MPVRFVHIRTCDEDGVISQFGGATIALSPSPEMDSIFLNIAFCSPVDNFSRAVGRELAERRLKEEGPMEVLPLQHPMSKTIAFWFIKEYGFEVLKDIRGRYLSTFTKMAPQDQVLITKERPPST